MGRHAVSVLGDGDFCMGATAIWTAVRHRLPMLILIDNNRSYFNDELHQENVAKARGREVANRWIGLRMEDPMPDIAMLARAQGATGIGPITTAADVASALEEGVGVLKQGGVAVIDFHVDPGEERQSAPPSASAKPAKVQQSRSHCRVPLFVPLAREAHRRDITSMFIQTETTPNPATLKFLPAARSCRTAPSTFRMRKPASARRLPSACSPSRGRARLLRLRLHHGDQDGRKDLTGGI
jgi:hypothetical protein